MTITDYQLQLSGLVLGPGTNYIVHSIDGFGLPDVRATDTDRPRQPGQFFAQDYLGGRTLTILITVRGASPAEVISNIDALMSVWQPVSVDTATVDQLFFQFPGQATRYFYGRPRRAAVVTNRIIGNNAPVVLEFQCADPRQYGIAQSVALGIFQVASGRAYPRTYPLAFGSAVSDVATVANSGNFAVRPVARITGPVSNPRIENVTAGQYVKFGIVLAQNDYLDIDFDAHTVVLNGTSSRYGTLTNDSQWWELGTGASQVKFSADSFDAGSIFSLSFASAWL